MFGGRGEGGVRWEGNRGRGEKESRGRRSEMGGKKGGGGEMEGKKKRGRGQKGRRRVSRYLYAYMQHSYNSNPHTRTNDQHCEEGFSSQVGSKLIWQFCQTGVIANGLRC